MRAFPSLISYFLFLISYFLFYNFNDLLKLEAMKIQYSLKKFFLIAFLLVFIIFLFLKFPGTLILVCFFVPMRVATVKDHPYKLFLFWFTLLWSIVFVLGFLLLFR
jgi:hypothetical protein